MTGWSWRVKGGWDDDFGFPTALVDEMRKRSATSMPILQLAGASWDQVIGVVSYHG
jgi:hypothetical protein